MRNYLFIGILTAGMISAARADLWQDLATYEYGTEPNPVQALQDLVKETAPDQYGPIEAKLIEIVASGKAPSAAKEWSCRMLQRVGTCKAEISSAVYSRRSVRKRCIVASLVPG